VGHVRAAGEERVVPTRDDVLAYIDLTGCGAAEASAHFGGRPPPETIRTWLKRRRDVSGVPTVVKPASKVGGTNQRKPTPEASPARATPAAKPAPSLAPILGNELRGYLRRGTRNLSRFIADANDPQAEAPMVLDKGAPGDEPRGRLANMNDVAAAARALKDLLSIAPDILTFDERTDAPESGASGGGPNAVEDAIRRSLERAAAEREGGASG
jgi:hypothetical protein